MSDLLAIVAGPLGADQLSPASLCSADDGAIASFVGVVRDHHHGQAVVDLRYECYHAMAEHQLGRIAAEARAALEAGTLAGLDPAPPPAMRRCRVIVLHGTGVMLPGAASLVVHVASPHRVAAFAVCRAVVEAIKADLPIWKHERYSDGTVAILPGS